MDVDQITELASQLPLNDRRRLIARLLRGMHVGPPSSSAQEELHPGSPAAILRAVHSAPQLQPGDMEELERLIEDGQLPVGYTGIFDDAGE